ncbi:hypothetical protein MMC30_008067 [Trapelia coarctata]|nr:hypothetical protein [Trapelia coarctata]
MPQTPTQKAGQKAAQQPASDSKTDYPPGSDAAKMVTDIAIREAKSTSWCYCPYADKHLKDPPQLAGFEGKVCKAKLQSDPNKECGYKRPW